MNFIIIPDGMSVDNRGNLVPSFVFREAIIFCSSIVKDNDTIFFAPGNNFNYPMYEQKAGKIFFRKINNNRKIKVVSFEENKNEYIDTSGNAYFLLKRYPKLQTQHSHLVCSEIHAKRAEYCFKKLGFNIKYTHYVKYKTCKDHIVKRLWYYRYKFLHHIYERIAFLRDFLILNFTKKYT